MQPILYSFRRCPYAIRARMAIQSSGIKMELREVLLKQKPEAMLKVSQKGTVPVLVLDTGEVIDESLEVILWALEQNDPNNFLVDPENLDQQFKLIKQNDNEFKHWLDRYKYHIGYPEQSQEQYRRNAELFIQLLEDNLRQHAMLIDDNERLVDLAIFPFVRQFAFVDIKWFEASHYTRCKQWLRHWLEHDLFKNVMKKYPVWNQLDNAVQFGT